MQRCLAGLHIIHGKALLLQGFLKAYRQWPIIFD
jgi:hypothetical protein